MRPFSFEMCDFSGEKPQASGGSIFGKMMGGVALVLAGLGG